MSNGAVANENAAANGGTVLDFKGYDSDSGLFSGRVRPIGRKQLNDAFSKRSKIKSRDRVTATLCLKWP
jgi:hypothetical protein